ncbi:MAG: hypothetical protein N2036_07300, partial [Bryobacteraceae bacterium]|nr:hypothetical protein [Bryobacteraceae bacterium]
CAATAYRTFWQDLVLPPQLGECASGLQPLWMECLVELLQESPELWDEILAQMPNEDVIDEERWDLVRRLTGLSEARMLELYREAGIGLRLERKDGRTRVIQSRKKTGKFRDHGPYWLLAQVAAMDDCSARFLLANYCDVLNRVPYDLRSL